MAEPKRRYLVPGYIQRLAKYHHWFEDALAWSDDFFLNCGHLLFTVIFYDNVLIKQITLITE